jgi:activator of 2-hydroxyglutaryl-CoA dehydratase
MIWTRQTAIEDRKNSLSKSIFRLIETVSKVKTMNQTSNIFESQIMKTIEVSTQQKFDYAILQIELNQFEQKRKRIELFKKIEKTKAIKIVEFFETQFAFLMNRIMIDVLQKKKFFKIMNSKKYKNTTQHDFNIFIRECWKIFEIRRHIYFDDKNKIFFIKNFLESVSTKNWKKHQKIIDIIFISWE